MNKNDSGAKRAKILIVDDEVIIAEYLQKKIERVGYNVLALVTTGKEAIEIVRKNPPDLILMDIMLDGHADGIAIVEEINSLANIPIIFLTAFADQNTIERANRTSPYGYYVKPINERDLIIGIEQALYRHSVEKIIKEDEFKFKTVADFTFDMEYWISTDSVIKYMSPSCQRITGYKPEEYIADKALVTKIIHPDDYVKIKEHFEKELINQNTDSTSDFEFRIISKSGDIKHVSHICRPILDEKKVFLGRRVTIRDITDRKKNELDLTEREEKYRTLFNNMAEGVFYQSYDGSISDMNTAALKFFNLTSDEFENKSLLAKKKWIIKDDEENKLPLEMHPSMVALKTGKPVLNKILGIYNDDKRDFLWVNVNAVPQFKPGQVKPFQVFVTLHDITDQKLARGKIVAQSETLNAIFDNAPFIMVLVDYDARILNINHSGEEFTSFSKEKSIGKLSGEVLHCVNSLNQPGCGKNVECGNCPLRNLINRTFKEGKYFKNVEATFTISIENTIENRDLMISTVPVQNEGKRTVLITVIDITEQKKVEEELRKSEKQLSNAMEIAHLGHWEYDVANDEFIFNDQFYKIFHTTASEVGSYKMTPGEYAKRFFLPEDAVLINSEIQKTINSTDPNFVGQIEHRILYADGEIGTITVRYFAIRNALGNVVKTYGVNQDITERKFVEERIKETLDWHESIFEGSRDAIFISDPDSKFVAVNKAAEDLTGYSKAELLTMRIPELHDIADIYAYEQYHSRILAGESVLSEAKIFRKNGTKIDTEFNNKTITISGKQYMHTTARDITERKIAENKLRESRASYQLLFENTGTANSIFDTECNLIMQNSLSIQSLGLLDKEFSGKNILDIFEPDFGKKAYLVMKRVMNTRQAETIEFEFFLQNDKKWFLSSFQPLVDHQNNTIGVQVISQDITDRKRAEEGLKLSEEKFKLAFTASPDAICFNSLDDGKYVSINQGFSRIFGFSESDVFGKSSLELNIWVLPEDREKLVSSLKENGSIDNVETLFRRKDGELIYGLMSSSIIHLNGVPHRISITRDITERKKSETSLKEIHEFNESMLRAIPFNINIVDEEGKILFMSENLIKQFGKESLGKKCWSLYKDNKQQCVDCPLRDGIELGETKISESSGVFDGKTFQISHTGMMYKSKKAILEIFQNVTERKKSEMALIESEERYKILFELSPDAIIVHRDNNILFANSSALKMLKAKSFEHLSMHKIMDIVHPTFRPVVSRRIEEMNGENRGSPPLYERFIRLDGSTVDVEVVGSSCVIDGEKAFQLVIRDVTDRMKIHKELEVYRDHLEELVRTRTELLNNANKKLKGEIAKEKEYEMMLKESLEKEKELNELKTRFISTTSHEFRTPLTSIFSSAELIQRYGRVWSEQKFNEHLNRVKNSVDYLTNLLDEILTISRAETGKISFNPQIMNLLEFCNGVISDVSVYANKKHILKFDYKVKQTEYLLDVKLLRFMLTNILSNAYKYSPNGGKVNFTISEVKNNLIFKIKDEGIGIPKEDREHLFKPFHRSINSSNIPGSGLGLSIVRKAVELHNGEINYTSKLKLGTVFTITIPKT